MDGKEIPRGKGFRFGQTKTHKGTDLVIWVRGIVFANGRDHAFGLRFARNAVP